MKYIIIRTKKGWEVPFIFPKEVDHDIKFEMVQRIRHKESARGCKRIYADSTVVSAGFIYITSTGFRCYGKSVTLEIGSRSNIDELLIQAME